VSCCSSFFLPTGLDVGVFAVDINGTKRSVKIQSSAEIVVGTLLFVNRLRVTKSEERMK